MSFFAQYADDAHRCALMRIRCASADASAWPTLSVTPKSVSSITLADLLRPSVGFNSADMIRSRSPCSVESILLIFGKGFVGIFSAKLLQNLNPFALHISI